MIAQSYICAPYSVESSGASARGEALREGTVAGLGDHREAGGARRIVGERDGSDVRERETVEADDLLDRVPGLDELGDERRALVVGHQHDTIRRCGDDRADFLFELLPIRGIEDRLDRRAACGEVGGQLADELGAVDVVTTEHGDRGRRWRLVVGRRHDPVGDHRRGCVVTQRSAEERAGEVVGGDGGRCGRGGTPEQVALGEERHDEAGAARADRSHDGVGALGLEGVEVGLERLVRHLVIADRTDGPAEQPAGRVDVLDGERERLLLARDEGCELTLAGCEEAERVGRFGFRFDRLGRVGLRLGRRRPANRRARRVDGVVVIA